MDALDRGIYQYYSKRMFESYELADVDLKLNDKWTLSAEVYISTNLKQLIEG